THPPLNTGPVDALQCRNSLSPKDFRAADPLSKVGQWMDPADDPSHCYQKTSGMLSTVQNESSLNSGCNLGAVRPPSRQMALANGKNLRFSREIRPTPPIVLAGGGGA